MDDPLTVETHHWDFPMLPLPASLTIQLVKGRPIWTKRVHDLCKNMSKLCQNCCPEIHYFDIRKVQPTAATSQLD